MFYHGLSNDAWIYPLSQAFEPFEAERTKNILAEHNYLAGVR